MTISGFNLLLLVSNLKKIPISNNYLLQKEKKEFLSI